MIPFKEVAEREGEGWFLRGLSTSDWAQEMGPNQPDIPGIAATIQSRQTGNPKAVRRCHLVAPTGSLDLGGFCPQVWMVGVVSRNPTCGLRAEVYYICSKDITKYMFTKANS